MTQATARSIVIGLFVLAGTCQSPARLDAQSASVRHAVGRPLRADDSNESSPGGYWDGFVVSRYDSTLLAARNRRDIALSRNDGRSFEVVLPGDGDVTSVAFDRAGTLYALRGQRLLMRRRDGSVREQQLDFDASVGELYTFGERLIWMGEQDEQERVGVSSDRGASWTWDREVPNFGNFGHDVFVENDGTIYLIGASEAGCGGGAQWRHRRRPDGTWEDAPWAFDAPVSFQLGASGWAYALDDQCDEHRDPNVECLSGIGPRGHPVTISPPLADRAYEGFDVASNGRETLAILEGRLLRLTGGAMRILAHGVPRGLSHLAVDARGRPVGLLRGRLVRWSSRTGYRVIEP